MDGTAEGLEEEEEVHRHPRCEIPMDNVEVSCCLIIVSQQ